MTCENGDCGTVSRQWRLWHMHRFRRKIGPAPVVLERFAWPSRQRRLVRNCGNPSCSCSAMASARRPPGQRHGRPRKARIFTKDAYMAEQLIETREIHLASRPVGWPKPENFRLVETSLPALGDNQLLVANHYMSVDPYMRGRMNDAKSYASPFQMGKPLEGGAVGEVIASTSDDVPVGSTVLHNLGWREHAVVPAPPSRSPTPQSLRNPPSSACWG